MAAVDLAQAKLRPAQLYQVWVERRAIVDKWAATVAEAKVRLVKLDMRIASSREYAELRQARLSMVVEVDVAWWRGFKSLRWRWAEKKSSSLELLGKLRNMALQL